MRAAVPPRSAADAADDADRLADHEGWHDFAARHPEVRGTLYMDYLTGDDRHEQRVLTTGQGPAVPPATRTDAVHEAKAKGAAKDARAEVRRADIPAELKELAIQRVVADAVNPPPQTIKLSRQQIVNKFPQRYFYVDIQGLSNDDRDLAHRIDDLSQWLRGMSFACFSDTANRTANLTRRLTPPFYELLANRARFNQKPSRSCRAAEAELLPKARRPLDQLATFAAAQSEANADSPWGPAWSATANRIAEANRLLAEHPMPEQQSPYETDEYEALAALSATELNRIAIRSATDYRIHNRSKDRKLLLPGKWTATWTESPNGSTEPDVRYWTPDYWHETWEDYIAAFSTRQDHLAPVSPRRNYPSPEELAAEAGETLADMKPAQCQTFVHRFLEAVFVELDQRAHTMPPKMCETPLSLFQNLGHEISRQEHYTAGRYRQVIKHTVDAYLSCRLPGRWQDAVESLHGALATPRRKRYDAAGTDTIVCLQEWLSLATQQHEEQLAEQRRLADQGASDPVLVWEAVISVAPKVVPTESVSIAATTNRRRRSAPSPAITPRACRQIAKLVVN